MRDEFGEIDPDEVDIIDIFDPDADVFGSESHEAPLLAPSRRRWAVPVAIASVVAVGLVGLLAWAPWRDDQTTSFPGGDAPALTLTERLVFDNPPAELSSSSLGGRGEEGSMFAEFDEAEGYFFAEPGVTANFFTGESDGRWAAFFAVPESDDESVDDQFDGPGATQGTVQNAPATISTDGTTRQIEFGPVNGWMFSAITAGMTSSESLEFANAVGVDDGLPTLTNEALGDMEPIGDFDDYTNALGTLFATTQFFDFQPGLVVVQYGDVNVQAGDVYSIATQRASSDRTLTMLQFMLGESQNRTVHGVPAIVVEPDNEEVFVAWVEGGRVVAVSGPGDVEAILALAESVRPATDDEWDDVEAVERDLDFDDFPEPPDQTIALYESADGSVVLTAEFDGDMLSICAERRADDGTSASCNSMILEPPILARHTSSDGKQFVVAMISREILEQAELRITLADGTVETLPLLDVSNQLPGPATAAPLPENHGPVELWIGDKLVKTLSV